MKEQIISLETAKLAKEKGFDEPCSSIYYDPPKKSIKERHLLEKRTYKHYQNPPKDGCSRYHACTQSLFQKWLRDNHNIHVDIFLNPLMDTRENKNKKKLYWAHLYYIDTQTTSEIVNETCSTYEEMLEIGLQRALKLI